MNAGPELERVIAEKVMGWEISGPDIEGYTRLVDERSVVVGLLNDFEPSIDIRDAWRVVEKVSESFVKTGFSGGVDIGTWTDFHLEKGSASGDFWTATFQRNDERNSVGTDVCEWTSYAMTAPLAICLAALKAKGVEVGRKLGRPRRARAGCKSCKPWKIDRRTAHKDRDRRQDEPKRDE